MRVLHVHSGNMYGGVETFLATLAREAPSAPGMESAFALCFEGRLSEELIELGHVPHALGAVRLSRPHTVLRARRALRRLLARQAFDSVVCHQPWTAVVCGAEPRRAGLPTVLWLHMVTGRGHWLNRLARLARPDHVLCNSRYTASSVLDWFPTLPVDYVHLPVSAHVVESSASSPALRRSLQTAESDVVVVHVGRLDELKGHRVLLAALGRLARLSGWTCWLVGGPQRPAERAYLEDLRAMTHDLGIGDRVRFAGHRTDVGALMRAADVYCQPNVGPEGFGVTFVEAMRAGLPIVTSGIGGACEVVDGHVGVLTAPGDVAAVSSALARLITDPRHREALGRGAPRRADLLCDVPRQMLKIQSTLATVRPPSLEQGAVEVTVR